MTAMTAPIDEPPREHVLRSSPPWRDDAGLTECGRPADGMPVIGREEFIAKLRRLGKTRTAMTSCLTCWETLARFGAPRAWDDDPVSVIIRESQRIQYRTDERGRFRHELQALAELVRRYPEEFTEIISGLGDTVRLNDVRAKKRRASRG